MKYSLALIDPERCAEDNGRVLGYDNAHGYHHRHYMGRESSYEFTSYVVLVRRFRKEVERLLKEKD